MKRSQINALLKDTQAMFAEHKFLLPSWSTWSADEWHKNPDSAKRIKARQMGWDITDFGSGDFERCGLILFCIRNGIYGEAGGKTYAEKIMVVRESQETPFHYHNHKEEDIINRGGGNLVVELHHKTDDGQLDKTRDVAVYVDDVLCTVKPGGQVILKPGDSVTLERGVFHRFYGEPGKGKVLTGEVSMVNDDLNDNIFLTAPGRFADIEEDEAPLYPLWTELPD